MVLISFIKNAENNYLSVKQQRIRAAADVFRLKKHQPNTSQNQSLPW